MQITPECAGTEKRIAGIEQMSAEEVLTKVIGLEEINLQPHAHNRHQILYILSGTLHVETGGVVHFVTDGQLVWIPGGVTHRLSSNNRQISLLTSYFVLEEVKHDRFGIYQADELIARTLQMISAYECVSRCIMPEMFRFVTGFYMILPLIGRKASFPAQPVILTQDSRLLPVLDYMKENLGQDLTIEQVAEHFGFSVRNLTRLFTNSGIRFVHYLNYQRVIRAIEILADHVMNVEQTAYEVGFTSPNSFSRVFRQITGESPSVYVRKQRYSIWQQGKSR